MFFFIVLAPGVRDLSELLKDNEYTQYVTEPTHVCGVVYVLEPVNECTKTVLFVTFIIRASHPGTSVWAQLPV